MIGVGDLVASFMDDDDDEGTCEDEKKKENTPPPPPPHSSMKMFPDDKREMEETKANEEAQREEHRQISVDSEGFEIARGDVEAEATSSGKKKEKTEEQMRKEEKKLELQRQKLLEKQKKEEEKQKRAEEKEMKRKEKEKEMELKRLKREQEMEEKEMRRKEREKEMEEKRLKREEEKRAREEKKRREQEEKNRIEEEKQKEKERIEALKRKQSEKLLGFFKQKSPKKKQKTLDAVAAPSMQIVQKLDEELFNKSKVSDVDVLQTWRKTLETYKAGKGAKKGKTTMRRHWNARVQNAKDFDPFRAKSSSPEDGDDDEVQIIKDDGGDVQIVDAPSMKEGKDQYKRYKKYYSFASYEMNYHERLPWYGYCLPPGRPTLSRTIIKKLARNYRKKCDEVDYECDSGGEDYEYESEGEDIDGDDLDDEDEDLEVEVDEEEDGQDFFIPDTRIIRGEFGHDDEEENLDAIRREDSFESMAMDPSTPMHVSKSKARRTVQQWVGEAKKQRKTLVVTSLAGSAEDGITQDADGVVLKGFEIITRTLEDVIICGVEYEESKQKTEDEAERKKLEQKKMKAKQKKLAKEEAKAQSDAAKKENESNTVEFGKTTFVTQEGLNKLFKTSNKAGAKLDSWVKTKDEPVQRTEIVKMPSVPESTDSELWESFRIKMLETNAATNPNPLGEYSLWFDTMDVASAVLRQMPTDIAKLITKLASQAGRPEVARVQLINAMTKVVSITRDSKLQHSATCAQFTVANAIENSPIKKAAPMPVLLEEAATAPSIKNIVASIFSSPNASRALKEEAFALVHECVVKHADLDPARKIWRNDIIRNVCHEKNFLEATASYFLNLSKEEEHRQERAMQLCNAITTGALCDTFCVMRSVEANRLASALCDFVSRTFGDEGGLKNTNLEDVNGNVLAFKVVPEALRAISNMVASCPNVFKSSKVCEGIEKTGKFVSRLVAIFGQSRETEKLTEDALNVLKSAIGFRTEKRAGDCLMKTLSDYGDVMVTLSLFSHATMEEVKKFIRARMENIRENNAVLEEVGIDH